MTISAEQFVDAWTQAPLKEKERQSIIGIYYFPNHEASVRQLAVLLGYSHYQAANLHFGRAAHTISNYLKVCPQKTKDGAYWFSLLAEWNPKQRSWTLHNEVVMALDRILSGNNELFIYHEGEIRNNQTFHEGASTSVEVMIYERSFAARKTCIEHYGCECSVCGFSFEKTYGAHGKDFIHVHHITPISSINKKYVIDPINDLRPICPNCHAMIHREKIALTIDELAKITNRNKIAY